MIDGSSGGRKKTAETWSFCLEELAAKRRGVIQVSLQRNEGFKRVLLEGLGGISIERTLKVN